MNKQLHTTKYLVIDFFSAVMAWIAFSYFRIAFIESKLTTFKLNSLLNKNFILISLSIGLFWLILYFFSGYYHNIYRKSRLQEFTHTLIFSFSGVIFLFFVILLDDKVNNYTDYYYLFISLLTFHFCFSYFPRNLLTTLTIKNIRSGKIGFNTIVIGSNGKAIEIIRSYSGKDISVGYQIRGFVGVSSEENPELSAISKKLGQIDELEQIIAGQNIEEVIIAIESTEHSEIERIIARLQRSSAAIKIIPDLFEILIGKTELSFIEGTPLLHVSSELLPIWTKNLKFLFDKLISVFFMIFFSPLFLFAAIGVKLSSRGPIIYKQSRIGLLGKEFTIYKFRSMNKDAEKNGPELSTGSDNRVTKFGQFMRRTRLDEIPQFYNVLIGDMSVVGPRPERQFFIDQIMIKAPEFMLLLKTKPGITSLGQVKFGYAENVDQMLQRLKYDIIYIKNMSLYLDFKILIFTILTILKGNGK